MNYEGLSDKRAYLQVIGCLMQDATLIEDIERPLCQDDFNTDRFYVIIYSSIYNLFVNGCNVIDEYAIDSYLNNDSLKEQYQIFKDNNGVQYLSESKLIAEMGNYDYYYHRVRKFSLLRYYEKKGLDTRFIYDSTSSTPNLVEFQNKTFDELTENEIVEKIESTFVIEPNIKFCNNSQTTEVQAGKGLEQLIFDLQKTPDVGLPLNNIALNTITRGARLGCLYMRSAGSGSGKTRLAVAEATSIGVRYQYDLKKKKFIDKKKCYPVLVITTEMSVDQLQTIILAHISMVDEEKILWNNLSKEERERVFQAAKYIEESSLYIVHMPDFDIDDIKNIIKKYNREFDVKHVWFDYVFSSMKLMAQISNKTKMSGLKEHQLLLVFVTELKSLAETLGVFIFTASQINGDWKTATTYDQNLLSGAKSLAFKLDVGLIVMKIQPQHRKKIEPIIHKQINKPEPTHFYSVYKVRRGKLTSLMVWCHIDMSTVTETPLFVTDFDYNLIDVDFTNIKYDEEVIEDVINENSILVSEVHDEEEIVEIEEQTESIKEETETKLFDW